MLYSSKGLRAIAEAMKQIESVAALAETAANEEENPKKRKRHEKLPGEPKRPPSAYLLFVSDYRKTDEFKALEGNNNEKMQKAGERWNTLPQDEKDVSNPYQDRYAYFL